ncbi:hypothetical protein L210DRAFT_3640832 [Boletus edulis BED1]|uniref:DUF6532 domain-containing protein n=1 Tax=Boletus edulis BED1 TaxID=1328754 RepID=A0AAD4C5K5_BOLED|nr:hypothetical protein L210DRAFT_3640832 [Boletus edulis BED1]
MAKHKIIYESDEDDVEERPKKARKVPEVPPGTSATHPPHIARSKLIGTEVVNNEAKVQRSGHSGKGSGGRLAAMERIEQIQMEPSKWSSKIDITTQGENVNPMAPSFQDVGEHSCRTRRGGSDEVAVPQTHGQSTFTQSPPQPEFLQATPNQQFRFRVPYAPFQAENNKQAPPRTRFCGPSSQPSSKDSGPPSSQSPSLFSGGSAGTRSTAATSHAPSTCSSKGERRPMAQRDPSPQHILSATSSAPCISEFECSRADASSNSMMLHLSAAPDYNDMGEMQIDEASPSEDDRIAEEALHQTEWRMIGDHCHPQSTPQEERQYLLETTSTVRPHNIGRGSPPLINAMIKPRAGCRCTPVATLRLQTTSIIVFRTILTGQISMARLRKANQVLVHAMKQPQASHLLSLRKLPRTSKLRIANHVLICTVKRPQANHLLCLHKLPRTLQQQTRSTNNPTGNSQVTNNDNGRNRPSPDLPASIVTERSEPWHLQHYDPPTCDVIEHAKQFSHCDAASINPFPAHPPFNSKAIEYIDEVIAEHRARGLIVSEGWWLHNASDITRLLWEDLGNWHSALRKRARTFVTQRYMWNPENCRERNVEITKNLLGNGGLFLRGEPDAEVRGHANNLAHPPIKGLVIDFFYTSPSAVSKLFPEVFAGEVPRVTVALAATALKVALDEIASGHGEVNFQVGTYSPVYREILGLMSKCDANAIHREKTSALLSYDDVF